MSQDPETIKAPFGENWTELTGLLCALGFSLFSSSVAAARDGKTEVSTGAQRRESYQSESAPSQTLMVSSSDPDTIFVPSGEKATERIKSLCAFVFSVLRSSVAAYVGRQEASV